MCRIVQIGPQVLDFGPCHCHPGVWNYLVIMLSKTVVETLQLHYLQLVVFRS